MRSRWLRHYASNHESGYLANQPPLEDDQSHLKHHLDEDTLLFHYRKLN